MKTSSLIEALLFSRAEPWKISELSKSINKEETETKTALFELEKELENRGLNLIQADDTVTLGTNPQAHEVLEKIYREELSKGLSKASIETLSVIMYGENVTRNTIDYIRGVNSGFILRSLLVRGLIERKVYPRDRKRFMYVPTIALLASLGVEKVEMLPDYEKVHSELVKTNYEAEKVEQNND